MKDNNQYIKLVQSIDHLLTIKDTVYLAIDGNSGAGKSTLASQLNEIYDSNIFHMDDYFLRPEQKTEDRLLEVGGNVDYVRFKTEIIEGLKRGRSFTYRAYDCKQMALQEPITVLPKRLNIIEGAYSMHPSLIDFYDFKVFLNISNEEQKKRILARNGEVMLKRFVEEWIPKENLYFEKFNIKGLSDLVSAIL